jgi:PilZ domain-containing protein
VNNKTNTPLENGLLMGKLVHLAIPIRWSLVSNERRGPIELGCTYDIHPRGARLAGFRTVNVGDLVVMERGRNKALCQVVWSADRNSSLRGQFAVQCIEDGKAPWDEELRQLQEDYEPVILDKLLSRNVNSSRRGEENRRRRPRYFVEGTADVIDGLQRMRGDVQQLSEIGARIAAREPLRPGADFRLLLSVFDISVALKAQVKYLAGNAEMGVEFHQIRRGDRPLLSYVLSKLRKKGSEEFVKVEVVREPLAAAAG